MVEVKLFGQPEIKYDQKTITFPFKKAEGLFYYLCVKKKISRSRALDLFWGEMPEQMARKSLRNAVYVIKKTFDFEIIQSPTRDFLELNNRVLINIDYENFEKKDLGEMEGYMATFLDHFYVKDAGVFEDWVYNMRHQIKEQLIEKLLVRIHHFTSKGQFNQADRACKKLINLDEFNEEAYRLQMKIYRAQGEHGKCIETFSCLSRILDSELSLKPDKQTRVLFDEIIKERSKKTETKTLDHIIFFGRGKELQYINDAYTNFISEKPYESIIVEGEMGIGKSSLIQSFLDTTQMSEVYLMKVMEKCYEVDGPLGPWFDLLRGLKNWFCNQNMKMDDIDKIAISSFFPGFSDHHRGVDFTTQLKRFDHANISVISRAIANLVIEITQQKKVVIILENINTYDEMSLSIIRELLYRDQNRKIFFLLTMNYLYSKDLDLFLTELRRQNYLNQINLKRFDQEEVKAFIEVYKNFRTVDTDISAMIYQESEGNPLFMTELIKAYNHCPKNQEMPSRMKDIFKLKYLNLSDEAQKIVDIASAFKESFKFEALLKISGKDDFDLMTIVEEIIQKDIFIEKCCSFPNESDQFEFAHHKLKEYVYDSLYKAKQKLIHKKIASYYEHERLQAYDQIIFHSYKAGDRSNYLKYKIKWIFDYLEMMHEMFPIVKNGEVSSSLMNQKKLKASLKQELEEINQLYHELQEGGHLIETELEIFYLNLMSRFYIITGKGDLGLSLTFKMIQLAMESLNTEYMLKGYKLMVFHYINTKQVEKMTEIITTAVQIAHKHGMKAELGVFIRLKGYSYILKGDYKRGENFLRGAVKLFEKLGERGRYILNIMACYYYLGESLRLQKCGVKAVEYYEKAIALAETYGYIDRLTLFYSSLGQVYYESEDFSKSNTYFNKAILLYEEFDFQWGRALTWGYMAMLALRQNEFEQAKFCLEKADYFQKYLNSQYEYEQLSQIRNQIEKQQF